MTEYMVLSERVAPLRGDFRPERLESVLNEAAADDGR